MKLLFDDGYQHISGDGAPDLRLHRVLVIADETLDAQMRLDPFEKQFDLPAVLVDRSINQRRQGGIVGQKYQRLACFWVFETDTLQLFGIILRGVVAVQGDTLIANNACVVVGRHRVSPACIHALLSVCHEERSYLMQREQPTKTQIAPIHDVDEESTGLHKHQKPDKTDSHRTF